jgi:hypothetical protein
VRKKDYPNDILFNFQSTGGFSVSLPNKIQTKIPQGPEYDSFKLQIIIKIVDDSGGILEYVIPTPVIVKPDISLMENTTLIDQITNEDLKSTENRKLNEGDLHESSQVILLISTMLNSECNKDKNSLIISSILFFNLYSIIYSVYIHFKTAKKLLIL